MKQKKYIEPERRGTPRGERIGYSAPKYAATLLALKRVPQKEIAEILKIPYGVLRTWRSQKRFKDTVEQHTEQYADIVLDHLLRRSRRGEELIEEYLNKPLDYVAANPPTFLTPKEFLDIKYYAKYTVLAIHFRVMGYWEEHVRSAAGEGQKHAVAFTREMVRFYDFLPLSCFNKAKGQAYIKKTFTIDNTEPDRRYNELVSLLSQKSLSERGKKICLAHIHLLQGKTNDTDMDTHYLGVSFEKPL